MMPRDAHDNHGLTPSAPVRGCVLCDRLMLGAADPHRLAVLRESVVILGDNQGAPGWCTLILREHVDHLAELPFERQSRLFEEVALVAEVIRAEFRSAGAGGHPPRINYECLGNVCPHVHWHVIPRLERDPTPNATVWGWSADALRGTMTTDQRGDLAARLGRRIASMRS